MSQEKPSRSRSRRFGVEFEEEKVWISFYRRAGAPAIAVEVMNQLESEPELKRAHLALYLRCKESLRTQKARQVRNKRIGQFVRMLFNAIFVLPVVAVRRLLQHGGDIAVECLPEVNKEPASPRVNQLSKKTGYSQDKSEFGAQAAENPVQEDAVSAPANASPAPASKAAGRLLRRRQQRP